MLFIILWICGVSHPGDLWATVNDSRSAESERAALHQGPEHNSKDAHKMGLQLQFRRFSEVSLSLQMRSVSEGFFFNVYS